MRLNTLPSHYFRPVGYRKDGRPIFPIAGGSEPPNQPPPPADPPNPPPANPPAGPVEAVDPETGETLGFPDKTPVEQMTDTQKANYWRNQTKVANKRVPKNLDQIQRDAQAWAEYQRTQKPPEQQAIDAAVEKARADALKEAAQESALALLRVTLQTRGKNAAEVDEIVDPLNPAKFLTQDGKLDTARVTAFVDKLAPVRSGGGQHIGQGRFDQIPQSRAEAGRIEAQRRFAKQQKP